MNLPARIAKKASVPGHMVERYRDTIKDLWRKRKAINTHRAYASDWKHFDRWCFQFGQKPLPAKPETVLAYLAELKTTRTPRGGEYSVATIARRIATIAHYHREAGHSGEKDPTKDARVTGVLEGIRRDGAEKPRNAKDAILVKHLKKGLRGECKKLLDYRNRALLLVGFTGAFRRSELVAIDVEHLTFNEEDAVNIRIPKSKTNQHGEQESVWIHPAGECCPVRALRQWLEQSRITKGPLFRSVDRHQNVKGRISTNLVAYIVKRFALKVGLDPRHFAAHSLRSGFVTQALMLELPLDRVQAQTRHRDVNTLIRYRRNIDAEKNGITGRLGL
jgi:site-specific recombinase XerD